MSSVRCSLASLLVVLFVLVAPGEAHAYVLKKMPDGTPLRWHTDEMTFAIDPTIETAVPGATEAIRRAVARWSDVPGAPRVSVTNDAPPLGPGFDRRNGIFYSDDERFAPEGRELAKTVITFDEGTGEIVDADVVIGRRFLLRVLDSAQATVVAYDFEHVIGHELGHALGLKDEPHDGAALMYFATLPNDTSVRAPSNDDTAGIHALYRSAAPNEDASTGCCAAPAGGRGAPDAAVLVVLLPLIARAMARRGARAA